MGKGLVAPIVVIGTGLSGYGLAKEFRKHDEETPLILITSDDGRSYSKPMLSTGYTKNHAADDLAQLDAGSMARMLKASVWTMTRVNRIDTGRQLIEVGDAQTAIHYGKLVLAVGAEVIRPPIEGDALELVYSVNDLLDYDDFRTAVAKNNVRKFCIIGAGLIGHDVFPVNPLTVLGVMFALWLFGLGFRLTLDRQNEYARELVHRRFRL